MGQRRMLTPNGLGESASNPVLNRIEYQMIDGWPIAPFVDDHDLEPADGQVGALSEVGQLVLPRLANTAVSRDRVWQAVSAIDGRWAALASAGIAFEGGMSGVETFTRGLSGSRRRPLK